MGRRRSNRIRLAARGALRPERDLAKSRSGRKAPLAAKLLVGMSTLIIDLPDLDATMAFGHRFGAALFPGAVVALVGPLGAGKTHLVRAVADGLGLRDGRTVSSPTF